MAGRSISSYFTTVGVDIDQTGVKKVDAYLKRIERRMETFTRRSQKAMLIDPKDLIDSKKLQQHLALVYRNVSRVTPLRINNFIVDQTRLNATVDRAMRTAVLSAQRTIPMNVRVNTITTPGAGGVPPRQPQNPRDVRPERPQRGGRGILGVGLGGGALAGTLGVYGAYRGLSALNTANQEIISAQLTTQAVTEAGGAPGEGPRAFEWLRYQANRVGFSYMEASSDYNNLLSNTLAAGLGVGQGQDIFQGFSEYGRAMGITPYRQNLVFNA